MEQEVSERTEQLELVKEIAHTMIHRMTLWQFIIKGSYWRKKYDSVCQKIADLHEQVLKPGE